MQNLRDKVNMLARENEQLRADIDRLQNTNRETTINLTNNYESRITQYNQKYSNLEKEYNDAINEIKRLQNALRDKEAALESLQYQLNSIRSNDEFNRKHIVDLSTENDRLKTELANLKRELDISENDHSLKDRKLKDLIEELDRLNSLLRRKNDEGLDKDNKVRALSSEN